MSCSCKGTKKLQLSSHLHLSVLNTAVSTAVCVPPCLRRWYRVGRKQEKKWGKKAGQKQEKAEEVGCEHILQYRELVTDNQMCVY